MTKAFYTARVPATAEATHGEEFFVASEEALFASAEEPRCDACGRALSLEEPDTRYAVLGKAVFLRARGGDVRVESAPLCPSCASAIGMTALARWEIEEEEG